MKAKFKLEFAPRFERRLKALERQDQIRILREAQILAENPYAGRRLKGRWEGTYSLRAGVYRIIYIVAIPATNFERSRAKHVNEQLLVTRITPDSRGFS